MFQTFKNAWKVPDLRKKLLFTLMILLLYRIGANIVVPYVNVGGLQDSLASAERYNQGIFGLINLLSGGAFSQGTLFALSVTPYITASIVMQLLCIAIPALERISKDGEEGKKKITKYTRWVTVGLAILTAYGYLNMLNQQGMMSTIYTSATGAKKVFMQVVIVATLCAGAAIVMWLGELIDSKGIGNGISMILFANILASGRNMAVILYSMIADRITTGGGWIAFGIIEVIFFVALTIAVIGLIVWFTNSERRISIQYAKRVVGRKMYGGQSSNLPLKMNMAGVMPVIFANSIVSIPATIAVFFPGSKFANFVNEWLGQYSPIYMILSVVLVVLFSYFYIMISFNPVEVANNIRNQGGAIPGIRPGKPTSDFIKKILNRVTFIGALFLIVIQCIPQIAAAILNHFYQKDLVTHLLEGRSMYVGVTGSHEIQFLAFFGTSLLIVVGVALETVRAMEAQLAMRNYKGFLD